jgi:hypothetical protein
MQSKRFSLSYCPMRAKSISPKVTMVKLPICFSLKLHSSASYIPCFHLWRVYFWTSCFLCHFSLCYSRASNMLFKVLSFTIRFDSWEDKSCLILHLQEYGTYSTFIFHINFLLHSLPFDWNFVGIALFLYIC